jgi:MarR family transcriptional regulator, transcriptional regulator for hemolysin
MTATLDRDPVVLIHDVARTIRTKFDQRARASGMTRAQWHILARVEKQPGLSQSELAAILDVEPITVARLVDRLEKRGLLERRPDPTDRRIWRLHNRPPAQPILEEISAYHRELNRDIDAHIGAAAREAMVDALLAVRARINAIPDPLSERVGARSSQAVRS